MTDERILIGGEDTTGATPMTAAEAAATPKKPSVWKRLALVLGAMGPGIIAASAGNDAGGISTYSTAGAQYGYQTLWMMFLMTFSFVVAQEIASRMGAITGKGLAALIRERFGVRMTTFAMTALLASAFAAGVANFAGIAAAFEMLGVSRLVSVPIAAVAAWLLISRGSFKSVERVLLILSSVFIAYVVAAFMAKPDWGAVAAATFTPSVRPDIPFIMLTVALVGTTIAPWMQFLVQTNVVERGVDARGLGLMRIDVITGAVTANLVAWFIIITTGTVLFASGVTISSAKDAALALAPAVGPYATVLFGVGLAAASFLATCVVPLTGAYAVTEAFGWERGVDHSFSEAPGFHSIFTGLIVLSALFILIPSAPLLTIMVLSQAVNGVLLPVLLVFQMKIVNDRRIMGKHKNGRLANALGWTTTWVLFALTAVLLLGTLAQALGLLPG